MTEEKTSRISKVLKKIGSFTSKVSVAIQAQDDGTVKAAAQYDKTSLGLATSKDGSTGVTFNHNVTGVTQREE